MKLFVGKVKSVFSGVIFLLVYIASLFAIERYHEGFIDKTGDIGVWSLPPVVLEIMSGEFRGIIADLLVIEAGARVGSMVERTKDGGNIVVPRNYNCKTIHNILSVSQFLEPSFQQTFILAQGCLAWNCGMVPQANAILQKAQKNRRWDAMPTQLLAFNTYFFLHDNAKAGEILLEASAEIDDPPYFFAILGARLAKKGGETETAIQLLSNVLSSKKSDAPGYTDIVERVMALKAVLSLEYAVKLYEIKFGILPESVVQLQNAGVIQVLPKNPYKLRFCINQKGAVFFDRPNCRSSQ